MSTADQIRRDAWRTGPPAGEIGEFEMIARLDQRIQAASFDRPREVLLALGDDAALLRPPPEQDLVLTCDIQIEGRHFRREWLTPAEVGARAATVNLSDLAAMGAIPVAALVSLGVPAELPVPALETIYDGLIATLGTAGAAIAGGNVSAAEHLILDVTLAGWVEGGRGLRRSGAQVGEIVFATGWPGRAAAALAALGAGDADNAQDGGPALDATGADQLAELRERFRAHYAAPKARLTVGRHLLQNQIATAAVDQSDGVAGDLGHICTRSGVAILLEETFLPIDPELKRLAALLGTNPLAWVLGASDDYELLFTAPAEKSDEVLAIAPMLGVMVSPIGRVIQGEPGVRLRREDGSTEELGGGWDHLREGR